MKAALLMVDVQNDFALPQGALPVPEGEKIIPLLNELQKHFPLILATKDWHPPTHHSFASIHGKKPGEKVILQGIEQILWPTHCVQNSKGADFCEALQTGKIHRVFHKGVDPFIDSYSAFYDNAHLRSTGLGDYLKQEGVDTLFMGGLATDYCVKYSVLDALSLGFVVYVIQDACKGIDLNKGDCQQAFEQMKNAGAILISTAQAIELLN